MSFRRFGMAVLDGELEGRFPMIPTMIESVRIEGFRSLADVQVDLPGSLGEPKPAVLIGANGSGKSNFLEAISLFHAAPRGIGEPISRMGGIREWLWKGSGVPT